MAQREVKKIMKFLARSRELKELTYKSNGSGNSWCADHSAIAALTRNPVDQLNGNAGPTEGIDIRNGFPLITIFPVTKQIMRLIS